MTVLAADTWRTNGHLIADVASLYLDKSMRILDPTFGRGLWWTVWRPGYLAASDLYPIESRKMGEAKQWRSAPDVYRCEDFTSLGWNDDSFDAVAFDPPYVATGGRSTTTMPEFAAAYGMTRAPRTPMENQFHNQRGLAECVRIVKPGRFILTKCQDYVSSGKLFPGTHHTLAYALDVLGLELVDRFEHVAKSPRPQPPGRRQVHARRNLSTLFVLRRRR